jgi:hypothetical protein
MRSNVEYEEKNSDFPEEEIIRQAKEGNAGAFEQLYRRYNDHEYSFFPLSMSEEENSSRVPYSSYDCWLVKRSMASNQVPAHASSSSAEIRARGLLKGSL